MNCPKCASEQIIKNGSIHNGKQKYMCKACGRQFVQDPQHRVISDETKTLIDKLLLEKLPLAGIARVTGVSERWLIIITTIVALGFLFFANMIEENRYIFPGWVLLVSGYILALNYRRSQQIKGEG